MMTIQIKSIYSSTCNVSLSLCSFTSYDTHTHTRKIEETYRQRAKKRDRNPMVDSLLFLYDAQFCMVNKQHRPKINSQIIFSIRREKEHDAFLSFTLVGYPHARIFCVHSTRRNENNQQQQQIPKKEKVVLTINFSWVSQKCVAVLQ